MRREKTRPRTIGDILDRTSRDLRIDTNIKRYALWGKWDEIVGSEVAAHARPYRWQGHVLVVRVEHPAWIQELSYLKPQLLERIRTEHSEAQLVDIRFEVGTLPALEERDTHEEAPSTRALSDEEQEFVTQAVQEICDPEIRKAAEKAMARSMAAKKR